MLRNLTKLGQHLRSPSKFSQQRAYNIPSLFQPNNCKVEHQKLLMKLADDFKKEGEILNAERIYRTIIDIYPTYKEAYQQLWNSWVFIRGLKVTEKELNDFERNYRKYIEPNEIDSKLKIK